MPPKLTLDRLPCGASGDIIRLDNAGALRRRLIDVGFMPGGRVTPLLRSFGGAMTAYLVGGAVIALRKGDAREIIVREAALPPP